MCWAKLPYVLVVHDQRWFDCVEKAAEYELSRCDQRKLMLGAWQTKYGISKETNLVRVSNNLLADLRRYWVDEYDK